MESRSTVEIPEIPESFAFYSVNDYSRAAFWLPKLSLFVFARHLKCRRCESLFRPKQSQVRFTDAWILFTSITRILRDATVEGWSERNGTRSAESRTSSKPISPRINSKKCAKEWAANGQALQLHHRLSRSRILHSTDAKAAVFKKLNKQWFCYLFS